MTAVDEDLIHTWQRGTVSRRYNRSSNKCLGNFFPPGPKEGPRSGRALFPRPGFHRAAAAMAPDQSARAPVHRLSLRRITQFPDRATLRAKECAGLASRCKEDSRQLDRKLPRHFRADDFSETGRACSGLGWKHFLARARALRPKHQRRESLPREISQQDSIRSHRYQCQCPRCENLKFEIRNLKSAARRAALFPASEPSLACRKETET